MPDQIREEIDRCMDELARQYAETHDENVKREIARLSHLLAMDTTTACKTLTVDVR